MTLSVAKVLLSRLWDDDERVMNTAEGVERRRSDERESEMRGGRETEESLRERARERRSSIEEADTEREAGHPLRGLLMTCTGHFLRAEDSRIMSSSLLVFQV